ncbi:hypothetical protein Vretimale_8371 [Volvox reticuliferus]|uniref:Uncharacterized protein n=1 Tax=Volvox reticuliferus TaxID=1737510 RepID=A0A8J4CH05_9CHLO|nr:hypothetical protein Vretifemale_11781 [Volvox reticuliferus]GIM03706.1 hypothetical protein Vretimale_8371 [Volvox reticuliferus]
MEDIAGRRFPPASDTLSRAIGPIVPRRLHLHIVPVPRRRSVSQAIALCRCSDPAQMNQATAPSSAQFHEHGTYQALVSELSQLSPQQLREAAYQRTSELLDSRFLFWLRDQERRQGLGPADQQLLSRLGQELTMMREWTEEQSNRKLLPTLASSLAYSNLRRWQEETGSGAPEVVPGVDLEQLYRLGEQEERKLRDSLGTGGGNTRPGRGITHSGIEEFTKHNKAYADLAAGVMARVRQRLMGYDDEGPPAAAAVLRALLRQMGSPEERANFLPDAFIPPGLQVLPDAAATDASSGGFTKPSFVVTTPEALMTAARDRLAALAQDEDSEGGVRSTATTGGAEALESFPIAVKVAAEDAASQGTASAIAAAGSGASSLRQQGASQGQARHAVLPSGEHEVTALGELLELIEEYDRQVYSRKTPLERMGHSAGPW